LWQSPRNFILHRITSVKFGRSYTMQTRLSLAAVGTGFVRWRCGFLMIFASFTGHSCRNRLLLPETLLLAQTPVYDLNSDIISVAYSGASMFDSRPGAGFPVKGLSCFPSRQLSLYHKLFQILNELYLHSLAIYTLW